MCVIGPNIHKMIHKLTLIAYKCYQLLFLCSTEEKVKGQ